MRHAYLIVAIIISFSNGLQCGSGEYLSRRSFRRRRSTTEKCKPCSVGKYKEYTLHTDTYCDLCESGRYQDETSQKTCKGTVKCIPGKYGQTGLTSQNEVRCTDCPSGKYAPSNGMENCGYCPSGKFTNSNSQSSCLGNELCPAGKWTEPGATKQLVCKSCPVNTYNNYNGSIICNNCPNGKYNQNEGKTDCIQEPSCKRWYILNKNTYTCYELYDINLYKMLVGLYWANIILGPFVLCSDVSNIVFQQYKCCICIIYILLIPTAAIITAPKPVFITDKMSDVAFYILLGIIIPCTIGNIFILVIKLLSKNVNTIPV